MVSNSDLIQAREEYIELIKQELLGPGSEISIPDIEHELISDYPYTRYSIGVLYPQNNKMEADNDDTDKAENESDATDLQEEEITDDLDNNEIKSEYLGEKWEDSIINEDNTLEEENSLDEEIGLATQNMPSSMGITFLIVGNSNIINCTVRFATYRKATSKDCRVEFSDTKFILPDEFKTVVYIDKQEETIRLCRGGLTSKKIKDLKEKDLLGGDEHHVISKLYKLYDQLSKGYVRIPHKVDIELDFSKTDYIDNNKELDNTKAKITALKRLVNKDTFSITIMLVNDSDSTERSTYCLFQPEIIINTKNNDFRFKDYNRLDNISGLNEEEQSLALQYRNKKVYATGLGTSADWAIDDCGDGVIKNDFFPMKEVPSMDFKLPLGSIIPKQTLSMKYLSDLDSTNKSVKIEALKAFVLLYEQWIEQMNEKKNHIDKSFNKIANKNIAGCRKSAERMKKGINILLEENVAWDAFQLSNRAMFMQRAHLKLQERTSNKNRYPDDDELTDILDNIDYRTIDQDFQDPYEWRPFQLAFILLSIESITSDSSDEKDLVDLIWFPTGGGKTEAYLGLTAFTIFYRRMTYPQEAGGTSVIMRYTLRLLAAQQFTRASTLICACEYIRVDATSKKSVFGRYPLGKERITIGLWIGGEHTPNDNNKAKSELKYLLESSLSDLDSNKDRHNKFQVLKCPWCGTKLVVDKIDNKKVGTFGYRMKNNKQCELFCPQEACFFNSEDRLPIQIVDEELYKAPPTLLFGTVDKFAMLPWNEKIGSFFATNSKNRTPELIIQDELHLISGPLGTMVGLYETAIDDLCMNKEKKTKIIASTATIRRAGEQCASLYDREVSQFPHPCLDAEDSFFAREKAVNYKDKSFGRIYVGLMPSGKTKAMMEIRSISALLQKIFMMDIKDEVKDKYWTLTVYFNSLKDLGKCSTLVEDDVKDSMNRMAKRYEEKLRKIVNADELTSRVSTTQLNQTLEKLEKFNFSKENMDNKRWPSNILLATNMISVGIDVPRLNTMLLVGQPKLTSEYIQASSRVGREFPGVVFTMYDGSKSRDRSHYEQFKSFHESFYKYVEPTGVTPFSKPARERALHAVVITLLRLLNSEISEEKNAGKFSKEEYKDKIEEIKEFIVSRNNDIIKKVNPNLKSDEKEINEEIDRFIEKWETMVRVYGEDKFCYGNKYMVKVPDEDEGRLMKVYNTNRNDPGIDTMTSMRNVDVAVRANVVIWEED